MQSRAGRDFQNISLIFCFRVSFVVVNFHLCSLITAIFSSCHIVKSQWHPNVLRPSCPSFHAAYGKDCVEEGFSPFIQSRSRHMPSTLRPDEWAKHLASVRQNRGKELLWSENSEQAAEKTFIRFVKLRQTPGFGFPGFYPAQLKNQLDMNCTKDEKGIGWYPCFTCLSSSRFSCKAIVVITLKALGFQGVPCN